MADKRAHALLPIGTPRGLFAKGSAIPRHSFPRFRGVAGNGVRVPLVAYLPPKVSVRESVPCRFRLVPNTIGAGR